MRARVLWESEQVPALPPSPAAHASPGACGGGQLHPQGCSSLDLLAVGRPIGRTVPRLSDRRWEPVRKPPRHCELAVAPSPAALGAGVGTLAALLWTSLQYLM